MTLKTDIQAISESFPEMPVNDIRRLRTIAYRLQELNVAYCNRDLTSGEENKKKVLQADAEEIAKRNNIVVELQLDLRGFPVKVMGTKHSNNFVGEGWGLGI
jgi:hypothetical protein